MHPADNKKSILLVEDEHVTCLMMERTLRRGGYHTLVVNSGEDALDILECVKGVDLVLMDINLGEGMNGIEAVG